MTKISIFTVAIMLVLSNQLFAQKSVRIAFYNVENLFDTLDGENDDAEFLPGGKNNWDTQKFNEKITHIREVLLALKKPIITGFSEIENYSVVRKIISHKDFKNYGIVHYESPDARGIDLAMIYDSAKLTLLESGKIRFVLPGEQKATTRDILWAKYQSKKSIFYVTVNHWPSRRGGADDTDVKRVKAAETVGHFIDSLLTLDPNSKIILLGDLNDHPENNSVQLLNKTLAPMITKSSGEFGGSYNYNNEWGILDHILISKGLSNGKPSIINDSGKIHSFPFLIEEYKGQLVPKRTYAGNKYLGGYSDHLPVSINIKL
jgi:predicted extracellular nuclease